MSEPQSVEDYKAALQAEWGQFTAKEPIDIDGVRAFNVGDPVPASHVKGAVVAKSQVEQVATKTEAVKAAEKKD